MFEELIPLDPVHFFAFQLDCHYVSHADLKNKHQLADLSSLHGTKPFADVSIGWHEQGIHLLVAVVNRFDQPDFPNIATGDSVELFFDTRDVKTSGYATRFCHHFFFLPEAVETNGGEEQIQAGEITHFRTDDRHELCDPTLLKIQASTVKKKRLMQIFIPSECLHGYDPQQFDRLGFTYRINRVDGSKQNFSASDNDFSIECQPSLWASLKLRRVT